MSAKRILCFGDSLTWGYIPGSGDRFDEDTRWTSVCQKILGEDYLIIEDGLCGRTTCYDTGRNPYQNGREGLGYALLSQKPLDLVVIFLGTNDLEFVNAPGVATGMDELVRLVINSSYVYRTDSPIFNDKPRVLLIAPPYFHEDIDLIMGDTVVTGKSEEIKKLAALYQKVADKFGAYMIDVSPFAKASPIDCIHIDGDSQKSIGRAIAEKIKQIL